MHRQITSLGSVNSQHKLIALTQKTANPPCLRASVRTPKNSSQNATHSLQATRYPLPLRTATLSRVVAQREG